MMRQYRMKECRNVRLAEAWMNEMHEQGYSLVGLATHEKHVVVMELRDPAKAIPIVPKTEQEHTAMMRAIGIAVDTVQKSQT